MVYETGPHYFDGRNIHNKPTRRRLFLSNGNTHFADSWIVKVHKMSLMK